MGTRGSRLRDVVRLLALPVIGICNAVGVAFLAIRLTPAPQSYASTSSSMAALDLAAGVALLASGLLALVLSTSGSVGTLAIAASLAWFAPDWVAWEGAPPALRSVAMLVAPFFVTVVAHLVASGSLAVRRRTVRWSILAAYGLTGVVAVGRAMTRNPLLDLDCGSPPGNCRTNAFLVWPDPVLADRLDVAGLALVVATGIGLALLAVWRLLGATPPARRAQWPLLVTSAMVGIGEAAAAVLLSGHGILATDRRLAALFVMTALAVAALGLAVGWSANRAQRISGALARLAIDIGEAPPPGGLRDVLARALGDPGLRLVYPLPGAGTAVDPAGMLVAPPLARPGQVTTPIVRGGETIALVVHDGGIAGSASWADTVGSAARLAVDNDRLQAEVLAQLRALGASRSRIVEQADRARQRMERDLHDGAQQRLLALSYELRLGRAAAARDGDAALVGVLDAAIADNQAILEDLRDLAHGIFPAVLVDAGLGAALDDLADRSTVRLELQGDPGRRCVAASESAVFVIVSEVVRSAAARGATSVRVDLERVDGTLRVAIADDGRHPIDDLTHLADRAGAGGGRLDDESTDAGLRLQMEVPCA